MGHPLDKIELIIMGGTFLSTPLNYQYQFIKNCYDAMNSKESTSIEMAKKLNEISPNRCIGLCIETRPDFCGEIEIKHMLEFGTTRVELGVQTIDDRVYKIIQRGHTVDDVVKATQRLREYGFKVHYHWMPGLPGSSPDQDLMLTKKLFSDERFRPDGLKIYPTVVVAGTKLEKWYENGRYTPYDDPTMVKLVADIKSVSPPYVRISRVLRDIPPQFITIGMKDSLRDTVKALLNDRGEACKCIRCREYGHRINKGVKMGSPSLHRIDYKANEGHEIFLSFEDEQNTLFGLLRLRIQQAIGKPSALIREIHVYGFELALGQFHPKAAQHRNLGRRLLAEAERISRCEFGLEKLSILSGIGVRPYYRQLGYDLEGLYMVKNLG
jgi:elongator complex protein 3